MFNTFLSILRGVWSVIEYPVYFCGGLFILFYFLIILNLIIFRFKGKKLKKGHYIKQKKKSFFRRIFIDLPNRYAKDLLERDPDFFRFQGLIIYEGRQRKW